MIDFTEFKQKLEMDKKYFIHTNELITEPEIAQIKELINEYGKSEVLKYIEKKPKIKAGKSGNEYYTDEYIFIVETKCYKCSNKIILQFAKTKFQEFISVKENRYKCENCHSKHHDIIKEQSNG